MQTINCTVEEAIVQINKRRTTKKNGYRVFVRPYLPTSESKGFEGCTCAKVTKTEFIKVIRDSLADFADRGAKISLSIPTKDYESFFVG